MKNLEQFLKDNGCFDIFIQNVDNLNTEWTYDDVISDDMPILGAFKWDDSPEGHDYWYGIHSAWEHALQHKK